MEIASYQNKQTKNCMNFTDFFFFCTKVNLVLFLFLHTFLKCPSICVDLMSQGKVLITWVPIVVRGTGRCYYSMASP